MSAINLGSGIRGFLDSVGLDIVVSSAVGGPLAKLVGGVTNLSTFFSDTLIETESTDIGTGGNDVLTGGGGRDMLLGLGGKDVISGRGNADDLSGGDGRDQLNGGAGHDKLSGDGGVDILKGGGGNDQIRGGEGNDFLNGGRGADLLDGGPGGDVMNGGGGSDTFVISVEESGPIDAIGRMQIGADRIDLSAFRRLDIDIGRDDLSFKRVEDSPFNEIRVFVDDPLSSRDIPAFDVLLGKDINPAAWLLNARFDFRGDGGALTGTDEADKLVGTKGIDEIIGGLGRDILKGLAGFDILNGGKGADSIRGGGGGDTIEGGAGKDVLRGGGGADHIEGGRGNDKLIGGAGGDTLVSGGGNDILRGGGGADTLVAGPGVNRLVGGKGADQFVFTTDALKAKKTILVDYDPSEDQLIFDGAEIVPDELSIVQNEITLAIEALDQGTETSKLILDAWDGILDGLP